MQGQKTLAAEPLGQSLNKLWPGLKYLGFGLYLAWLLLISDTCSWVSDIDANGSAIVNGNLLITLCGPLNTAAAIVLIASSFMQNRVDKFLASAWSTAVIGLLGIFGAICVIGSGPYFFGGPFALNIHGMFSYGAVIYGITSALLVLKCARAYGRTEPYRVFVYGLLAELLSAAVYSVVMCNDFSRPYVGGPPTSGIIALALLPLASSFVTSVAPNDKNENASKKLSNERLTQERGSFLHFLAMIFVLSLSVSISLGFCANNLTVPTLQIGMRVSVFIRLVLALILIALVATRFHRVPLATICMLAASFIAISLALFPLMGLDNTATYITVNSASSLFDIMMWSLLSFVAFKHSHSTTKIFGLGYGVAMAGQAAGWLTTKYIMQYFQSIGIDFGIYVALAFVTILLTALVFSGRDFANLFSPDAETEFSMKEGENLKALVEHAEPVLRNRPWRRACKAVCDEAGLSPRERDIFTRLSTGYTADAIANELSISANTVRTHVHNIYGKLDVHSRQELIDKVKAQIK